jgi:hypothetical protein
MKPNGISRAPTDEIVANRHRQPNQSNANGQGGVGSADAIDAGIDDFHVTFS